MNRYEGKGRNISLVISVHNCRIHYSPEGYFFKVRVALLKVLFGRWGARVKTLVPSLRIKSKIV